MVTSVYDFIRKIYILSVRKIGVFFDPPLCWRHIWKIPSFEFPSPFYDAHHIFDTPPGWWGREGGLRWEKDMRLFALGGLLNSDTNTHDSSFALFGILVSNPSASRWRIECLYRVKQNLGKQVLRIPCPKFRSPSSSFVVFLHGQRDLSSLPWIGGAAVQISWKIGGCWGAVAISSKKWNLMC